MLFRSLVDSLNGLRNRSARLQFQANAQSKFQTLEHNKGEFLENFHQNIYQISELIKCRKDYKGKSISEQIHPLNSVLKIGQWIDVNNAMNNWLEAQIVDTKDNMVKIHYTDLSSNWDEWIDSKSSRIAIFRSHTIQSPTSNSYSFQPQVSPHVKISNGEVFDNILGDYLNCIEIVEELLKSYIKSFEETVCKLLSAQMAPILDRLGRSMIDLSRHLIACPCKDSSVEGNIIRIPRVSMSEIGLSLNPGELSDLVEVPREREVHIHQIILSQNENSQQEFSPSVINEEPLPINSTEFDQEHDDDHNEERPHIDEGKND